MTDRDDFDPIPGQPRGVAIRRLQLPPVVRVTLLLLALWLASGIAVNVNRLARV